MYLCTWCSRHHCLEIRFCIRPAAKMCCWRLLPLSVLIYLCPCVVVVVVCQSFGLVTWPTRFTIHVQSPRVLSIKRDFGRKRLSPSRSYTQCCCFDANQSPWITRVLKSAVPTTFEVLVKSEVKVISKFDRLRRTIHTCIHTYVYDVCMGRRRSECVLLLLFLI